MYAMRSKRPNETRRAESGTYQYAKQPLQGMSFLCSL